MKLLTPPLKDLRWPYGFNGWIKKYLTLGFRSLSPMDIINIDSTIQIQNPNQDDIDQAIIYQLAKMGYTLGAIREFFARKEIVVKPDVDRHYAQAVCMQTPTGRATVLNETPLIVMLKVLRKFLDTPEGQLTLVAKDYPWIYIERTGKTAKLFLDKAYSLACSHALRLLCDMPTRKEVVADLKARAYEDWVLEIKFDGSNYYFSVDVDFLIKFDLFPKNLVFFSCRRSKRR